ncbi:MAG: stage II sporulation protein P [Clostridia bacterium]|nr:stage II sporulation protein P [Clostridia bacterium]
MFNITISLKKIIKKIILIIIVVIIMLFFIKPSKKILKKCCSLINQKCDYIIGLELSLSDYEKINLEKGIEKILSSELVAMNVIDEVDEVEEVNSSEVIENTQTINIAQENIVVESKAQENKVQDAVTTNTNAVKEIDYKTLKTKVIADKNLKETYNAEYKGVKIKNESKYTLTQEILTPNVEYTNKDDILIFHTHTCESYTPTKNKSYLATGNYRTTDLNYTVSAVADVLAESLINKNFNVIHDTTYHDYPSYTGSYSRSLVTVKNILNANKGIQNVIDLHRDAVGNGKDYGPAVMIGEEKVAQLMFVIGTNGGGLEHSNWKTNLKFAIKIQEKANEMFPGLFRPIIVRNSRYNQHLADSACIIEVGATGNTLEECEASMKYLAEVLEEVMKG